MSDYSNQNSQNFSQSSAFAAALQRAKQVSSNVCVCVCGDGKESVVLMVGRFNKKKKENDIKTDTGDARPKEGAPVVRAWEPHIRGGKMGKCPKCCTLLFRCVNG